MKAEIAYFTEKGRITAEKIRDVLKEEGWECDFRDRDIPLAEWTGDSFRRADLLVFVSACGIAVRSIAPFIKSKTEDPAVIVADDLGRSVISLLSGHIGGANEITEMIAEKTGGYPVITTATDVSGKFAVDTWACGMGMKIINPEMIKEISMMILRGEKVPVYSDLPFRSENPQLELCSDGKGPAGICISPYRKKVFERELRLVPPCVVIGAGCRKGVRGDDIMEFACEILERENLYREAVATVASVDLKKDEKGMLDFADMLGAEFVTYSAEELEKVQGDFPESEFVKKITGTDNVCQRAAVLASDGGRTVAGKQAKNGITIAVALKEDEIYAQ